LPDGEPELIALDDFEAAHSGQEANKNLDVIRSIIQTNSGQINNGCSGRSTDISNNIK
jgi:hypothetical protein